MTNLYKFYNLAKSDSEQFAFCENDRQAEKFATYLDSCDCCSALDAADYTAFALVDNATDDQFCSARDADDENVWAVVEELARQLVDEKEEAQQ